jgi:hypothetical protein
MTTFPTPGDSSPDLTPRVRVVDVCKTYGCTTTFYYTEARAGRAPVPQAGGITAEEANAWLAERRKKRIARAAAGVRRREMLAGRAERVRQRAAAAAKRKAETQNAEGDTLVTDNVSPSRRPITDSAGGRLPDSCQGKQARSVDTAAQFTPGESGKTRPRGRR